MAERHRVCQRTPKLSKHIARLEGFSIKPLTKDSRCNLPPVKQSFPPRGPLVRPHVAAASDGNPPRCAPPARIFLGKPPPARPGAPSSSTWARDISTNDPIPNILGVYLCTGSDSKSPSFGFALVGGCYRSKITLQLEGSTNPEWDFSF